MSGRPVYTEEVLLEIYAGKAGKLGRLPTVAEINADPEMPSYITYIRRLGGKKEIYRKLSTSIDPRKLKSRLCKDCIYDPLFCGRDYDDCVKEAELYFRMLDSKDHN
jgi:RNase P subunit RPR2